MWQQAQPDPYGQWRLQRGVLRSRADPSFALCLQRDGCVDGGGVHMWRKEEGQDVTDMFARWQVEGGALRASSDPRFCLCVKQSGLCDGGHVHVWSYGEDGPDEFGQWLIEDVDDTSASASLAPAARALEAAVAGPTGGGWAGGGEVCALAKTPLVQGLEAFAVALDALADGLGKNLTANVAKMRKSKATLPDEEDYRAWLLSEAPVHAAAGGKGYVDDSAWMANLWIGRMLEFFVELFAKVHAGGGTADSCQAAYQATLKSHHNALQRAAFGQAVKKLPARERLMNMLGGAADVEAFVAAGRSVYKCCLELDKELARLSK